MEGLCGDVLRGTGAGYVEPPGWHEKAQRAAVNLFFHS